MTPQPRSHTVDCRGLPLQVWEWPGDGPLVLLHHGFLDHARSWDPVAAELAPTYRVLAVDARGHGRSGWVGAGGYYHFQDYVFDLVEVLDTLAPGAPVALVGHSMGGAVCSYLAGAFPDRVAAYVSMEGLGPLGDDVAHAPDRMVQWIEGVHRVDAKRPTPMADVAAAAARLRQYNPRLDEARSMQLAAYGTRPVAGGVVWAFDPRHRTRSPQPFNLEQAKGFWRRITAPVHFLYGSESPFVYPPEQRRVEALGAEPEAIPGAGHMLHHDQPVGVAAAIRRFLERSGVGA